MRGQTWGVGTGTTAGNVREEHPPEHNIRYLPVVQIPVPISSQLQSAERTKNESPENAYVVCMNEIVGNIAYAASDVAMTNPCCLRASIVEKHNATADIERGGSGSTYHHPHSNARMTRTTLLIYHYAYLSLSVRKKGPTPSTYPSKDFLAGVWQKRQYRPHIRGAFTSRR